MKRKFYIILLAALLLPVCAMAQGSTLTIERKYKVHWAGSNSMPGYSIEFSNGKLISVRYLNHSYGKEFGLWVNIGETGDNNGTKYALWKLGSVTTDQWMNEKIEIDEDGTISYYQNGNLLKSQKYSEMSISGAQSMTLSFNPYGWYTGHYHYMDDLKISKGNRVFVDDSFNTFNSELWQTPTNPDGVRADGGIMKMDQLRTDQDFNLRSKPISLASSLLSSQITLEYKDYKFNANEPDYKLYEDVYAIRFNGYAYCESTHKLYCLDGTNNIIEYNLTDVRNKQVTKRSFVLPFQVEITNNTMEVSPNGEYLAFIDAPSTALHIISTATGKEIAVGKLDEKYSLKWPEYGRSFAFQSDNEVLVAGQYNVFLYNIKKKKGKRISLSKAYPEVEVPSITGVTSKGHVSTGWFINLNNYDRVFTFVIRNGKLESIIPHTRYSSPYGGTIVAQECASDGKWNYTFYDEKTGGQISADWVGSDRKKYKFLGGNNYGKLSTIDNRKCYLQFNNMNNNLWIENYQFFIVWSDNKKMQIFNHALTENEMTKQWLRSVVEENVVEAYDVFIRENPNSSYTTIAREKRQDCIRETWKNKISSPNDNSIAHAIKVKEYIDQYGSDVDVSPATAELNNIYVKALENIGRTDIDGFESYIEELPQSPYIKQARQKLQNAYRYRYEELCQTTDLQAYADYCEKYPESPYIEDLKERGRIIYQKQQEEEQRIKEDEERRRIEEMRQRNAAKLNSVGKRIYWYETATYKINNDDGLLMSIFKSATGLDKLDEVKYNVRYTAIVEAIIGETSVKCVISNVQIEDPSWASANYLKYKKYAISDVQENLGRTRVLQLDEFEL